MYFKIELLYSLIFIFSDFVLCDIVSNYIPQEVINRKGGMSRYKKNILFQNGIGDVYMGEYLSKSLTSLDPSVLIQYAVCEGPRVGTKTYKYFFCPELSESRVRDFCCGKNGEQKCCIEDDFRSNVKFIRSDLYASISTILGVSIGLLNMLIVTIVITYWCLLRRRNNQPKSAYQVPASSIPMNYVTYPSRSDLTENTISKSSLHIRNNANSSIISKPMSNTPSNSIIIAPRPMKKR